MKVIDLRCPQAHRFEGWFASEADYQSQSERRLLTCPMCNSPDVQRLPSAPRVHRSSSGEPAAPAAPERSDDVARRQAQAHWLQAVRRLVATSEDVGDRFAREARRIHHGEAEARSIRGQASGDEVASLRDEGIEVLPVVLPDALKGPVH